tara:strand:- start:64 stop:1560 length:1497 start_codon:yes stop_codon:yes gene_type:complete
MTEEQEHTKRDQVEQRREKLQKMREQGFNFPNHFKPTAKVAELIETYSDKDAEWLEGNSQPCTLAGRIITRRLMGKASFFHLQDATGRFQVYCRMQDLGDGEYEDFLTWDLGDIVFVEGKPFVTKKGELSLYATSIQIVNKSLHPLPDKFHGLHDIELCYRQRYLDIMVNQQSKDRFIARTKIIKAVREGLEKSGFFEVETPMMQAQATGANAKPFVTHHNALDMQLFLRVAPELYLKRLVVGGFEKIFEINRNFRNEGISTRHNPEFTMVEYYQAYADYQDMMDVTESLLKQVAQSVLGSGNCEYQGYTINWLKPFQRMTMTEAITMCIPEAKEINIHSHEACFKLAQTLGIAVDVDQHLGEIQLSIFEEKVEEKLQDPCFITQYPTVVSPLARRSDDNPDVTDRFELFIHGKEIANGFSELNDPDDQASRFTQQALAQERGDDEAMPYDADYIKALEYAMPPTAGVGIGIDRLVMLLTDAASIRDIILFPLLKVRV